MRSEGRLSFRDIPLEANRKHTNTGCDTLPLMLTRGSAEYQPNYHTHTHHTSLEHV